MSGILLIEHDALMRSLLAEWLTAEGYCICGSECATADSAAAADLVIIDVYMPREAGLEQVRRARTAHPYTPIIAVSGQFRRGLPCTGTAAQALGVERTVAKPFSRETLLDAVRSLIGPPPRHAADAHRRAGAGG